MTETQPEIVTREAVTLAVRRETVTMDGVRDFFDSAYGEVARVAGEQGVALTGPAYAVFFRFDPATDGDIAAGFPTSGPVREQDGVVPLTLDAVRVVRLEHRGSYDGLGDAHGRLHAWAGEHGHTVGAPFTETYVTEPTPGADPASMITLVEYPVV